MNIHKNAGTPPDMRVPIVARPQAGETPRAMAGAGAVSPATVSKWLRRHESEGVAGLEDRTSRPRRPRTPVTSRIMQVEAPRRNRQPFRKIARETGLSLGPAARIAKAKGPSRLSALDQTIAIVGDEKTFPGEMLHIGIKKLGRSQGTGRRITGDRTRQGAPPQARRQGLWNICIGPPTITPGWPTLKSRG
ncbi:MAG: leucine zipper domain-containing protein [Methylocella sp.]